MPYCIRVSKNTVLLFHKTIKLIYNVYLGTNEVFAWYYHFVGIGLQGNGQGVHFNNNALHVANSDSLSYGKCFSVKKCGEHIAQYFARGKAVGYACRQ